MQTQALVWIRGLGAGAAAALHLLIMETCWCGKPIQTNEKRCLFHVAWCLDCYERILRSCPRALRIEEQRKGAND